MASWRGNSAWRTLVTTFILLLLADIALADSDSWISGLRLLRIIIPIVVLIVLCGGGGYCCRRRRNRLRAAQANAGAEAGWVVPQPDGQPTGQPYTVTNGAYSPAPYGYATNYNTEYTGSYSADPPKTGPDSTANFSAPPPSYAEVAKQKATETRSGQTESHETTSSEP